MEKPTRKAMVALLINKEGKVLLAQKQDEIHHENGSLDGSRFTYNGPGGKTEPYDFGSLVITTVREVFGEMSVLIVPWRLKRACRVYFYRQKGGDFEPFMDVTFFFAYAWFGTPKESKEMGKPCWFDIHQDEENGGIPWSSMMPADEILFKKAFSGERFVAEVKLFSKIDGKKVPPEINILDEEL